MENLGLLKTPTCRNNGPFRPSEWASRPKSKSERDSQLTRAKSNREARLTRVLIQKKPNYWRVWVAGKGPLGSTCPKVRRLISHCEKLIAKISKIPKIERHGCAILKSSRPNPTFSPSTSSACPIAKSPRPVLPDFRSNAPCFS